MDNTIFTPIISKQKFSDLIGLPLTVLNYQIQKGYYPTIKIGKYVLINMQALSDHASKHGENFAFKQ